MALNNVIKVLSGGFRMAFFMPIDSSGYFSGATGSLAAGPVGSVAYLISGVKVAAYKAIEPLVLLGTGEDQVQGQLVEPQQTLPTFDITGSVSDLTLEALTQNTLTYNIGNATFGVIQPYLPSYIDAALMFMRLSISKDSATTGGGNWDGVLFPKVKMVAMHDDGMSEKKITDFKYHVIANPTTILPLGITLSNSNFATINGVEFPFTTPNKLLPIFFKGDGVTTNFTIPVASIPSSGQQLAPGFPNVAYKEGTVVTPTVTLVGNNYQFAISPAPASNARVEVWAEFL